MQNIGNNIIDYLVAHALKSPDLTAFIILENSEEAEKKVSFSALTLNVKTLAASLTSMQLENNRVLLVYQDIYEFIVSFLACQYAGIIPVPVPYIKGKRQFVRLSNIIEDAAATAVLCAAHSVSHLQQGLSGLLSAGKIRIVTTDTLQPPAGTPAVLSPVYNETSFIQYTSGSTGKPKGVIISGNNLIHNQQLIEDAFGCDADSVIFSWLPFHHDMGLIGNILHAIYIGCTCVLMSPFHFMQTPLKWLKAISRFRVTHSGGPNFAYDLCVDKVRAEELSGLDLSGWEVAYNGSEPVRHETLQRFSNYYKSAGFEPNAFYPCYGLAEATLLVTGSKKDRYPLTIFADRGAMARGEVVLTREADPQALAFVSAGKVAAGIDLRIIDRDDQHVCGDLEKGEVCISGESVTKGYWNKTDSDLFYDRDGKLFLRTGDLGFLYEGELFVHGRIKELMIVRGQNYYPADIEKIVAESHIAIMENGVAAFSVNELGEDVVIAVEIKRNFIATSNVNDVIAVIDKAVIGVFGLDVYDIILTTPMGIPRTTSGKLQRIRCRAYYKENGFNIIGSKRAAGKHASMKEKNGLLLAEVVRTGNYNTIKAYLLDIIACKVGHLSINPADDNIELTEIGIDSLRSMELINTINKDLNINMEATKVLQLNTLAGLINVMENMLWLKNGQTSGKEIII